jgi:hypothetical protein
MAANDKLFNAATKKLESIKAEIVASENEARNAALNVIAMDYAQKLQKSENSECYFTYMSMSVGS